MLSSPIESVVFPLLLGSLLPSPDLPSVRFSIDLMSCDIPPSTLIGNLRDMVNSELLSDVTFVGKAGLGEWMERLDWPWIRLLTLDVSCLGMCVGMLLSHINHAFTAYFRKSL